MILRHPVNGELALYFGGEGASTIEELEGQTSAQMISDLLGRLQGEGNMYVHEWEEGDVLVWDNLSVFHRSMGGYGNHERLLYRGQARMFQDYHLA